MKIIDKLTEIAKRSNFIGVTGKTEVKELAKIVTDLTLTVKLQQKIIESLQADHDNLKKRNAKLEDSISKLKAEPHN